MTLINFIRLSKVKNNICDEQPYLLSHQTYYTNFLEKAVVQTKMFHYIQHTSGYIVERTTLSSQASQLFSATA